MAEGTATGDGDVGTVVVSAEEPDRLWLSAEATCTHPGGWRLLYEQERARSATACCQGGAAVTVHCQPLAVG